LLDSAIQRGIQVSSKQGLGFRIGEATMPRVIDISSGNYLCSSIWLNSSLKTTSALINQVKKYKQDKTVPQLADKNFTAVAEAVTLGQDGKIMLTHKNTNYKIIPFEDIDEKLNQLMANPVLAVHRWDCLYKRIQVLNLLGISQPLLWSI